MAWSDNKEFFAVARKRWKRDIEKKSDAGASQRLAHRFEGWVAAKVESGATSKDLSAPKLAKDLPKPEPLTDEDLVELDREAGELRRSVAEGTEGLECLTGEDLSAQIR